MLFTLITKNGIDSLVLRISLYIGINIQIIKKITSWSATQTRVLK